MTLRVFVCAVVLTVLAAASTSAYGAPMVMRVGSAEVRLTLSPDPPQPGLERATIDVRGVSADALASTTVSYASRMPLMDMSGAGGTANAVAGRAGQWTFDLPMTESTRWAVTLDFTGGVSGSTTFAFDVTARSRSTDAGSGMVSAGGGGGSGIWQTAAIALAILFAFAAIAVWNLVKGRDPADRPKWLTPSTAALAVAAVVVILGISLLQNRFAPQAMDMNAMSNVHGTSAVPVTLAVAGRPGTGAVISAPGVIAAFNMQDISARTPGVVSAIDVYIGDHVSAGQVIATLSEPDLAAQAASASAAARSDYSAANAALIEAHHHAPNELSIAQADARAKLEQARYWRDEMRRERMLLDNGAVSLQEFQSESAQAASAFAAADAAGHQVEDARANIELRRAESDAALARASSSSSIAAAQSILAGYATLVAPADGVVVSRLVDAGSYVAVGTPVLRIAVIGKVRIQASVAQEDLANITIGSPLVAVIDGETTVHAAVTAVQPAADPIAHTATVEAIVDNQRGRLRPGTYVRVTIKPRSSPSTAGSTVPSSAIVGSGQNSVVWSDVDGTAHRVPVTVLTDDGNVANVSGAVKPGDRIVVVGGQDLQEGVPILDVRP